MPITTPQLGFVYLQAGLTKTANECFETALGFDPENRVAIRHYEPESGQSGGILGKLSGLFSR